MKAFVRDNGSKMIWALLTVLYAGIVAWAAASNSDNLAVHSNHESRIQVLEKQNAAMASDIHTLLIYAQENRAGMLNLQQNLLRHMER